MAGGRSGSSVAKTLLWALLHLGFRGLCLLLEPPGDAVVLFQPVYKLPVQSRAPAVGL